MDVFEVDNLEQTSESCSQNGSIISKYSLAFKIAVAQRPSAIALRGRCSEGD